MEWFLQGGNGTCLSVHGALFLDDPRSAATPMLFVRCREIQAWGRWGEQVFIECCKVFYIWNSKPPELQGGRKAINVSVIK